MKDVTFRTRVRRRRGKWQIDVPVLPADSPIVQVGKLDNAAPLMIDALSRYLGVSAGSISVVVNHPVRRPPRRPREWATATAVQVLGGIGVLASLYVLTGITVTLLSASVAAVVLGTLYESGPLRKKGKVE